MVNKILIVTAVADLLFLASGAIQLGFSLIAKNQMVNNPTEGREATRFLIYKQFPLTAGMANGILVLLTFVLTVPGFALPKRIWLKVSGYLVTICAVFTLCLGVFLWVMTMHIKKDFESVYLKQSSATQDMIQTSFQCCGYINSTTPAYVTDSTCPSPAAAALLIGCANPISSFSNILIDNIFTALFGIVGIDAIFILCMACLLKDRKESERFRYIDMKRGYQNI